MPHVMQFDPGFFVALQGGLNVGQLVTVAGVGGAMTEYWYLYAPGQGSPPQGYAAYKWPSSTNTDVTTRYLYEGTTPSGWNPQNPAAYKTTLQNALGTGLVVQYVVATCTAPALKGAKKKGAAKSRGKTAAKSKVKGKKKARR